jgi:hypothetical protein
MRFSAQVIVTLLLLSIATGFLGGISKSGQSVVSVDEQTDGQEGGLEVLSEEATVYGSGSGLWSLADGPAIQSGWSALTWQPDPKGAIWELDISPDGERLAAVDIGDHRLYVWNISDGRVLLWVGHSKAIVDVVWLSNDWVLVADGGTGWYSYEVIDDGSARPQSTAQMRSGDWTDSMTGTYNGWLWGLDASISHSKVVFCGNIDHLNMGGEVVIADIDHFIDGSAHNARHFLPQFWSQDCDISADGTLVAALGRNMTNYPDGGVGFRDHVYVINADTGALDFDRLVAGANSTAWAIDWEPFGLGYTIAYNHPTPGQPGQWEGVASLYDTASGGVMWYSAIPQNVSSLRWLSDGNYLGVGLYDPGRISFIDSLGNIQTDFGWHSVMSGSTGQPEDITSVATIHRPNSGTVDQWIASGGKDGSIEIWSIDQSNFEIVPIRRFGPHTVREIAVDPILDLVGIAESSGTITIRSGQNGSMVSQCFHPEFGQYKYDIPNVKSVAWGPGWVAGGFSDGMVIGCDLQSKWAWQFDLRSQRTVGSFGRVAVHPQGQYMAVSWSENLTDPTKDGRVAIVDPQSQQILKEWSYAETHWTLDFNEFGGKLASVSQSGDIRIWNTSDPNPANWMDDGSPYSHQGYVGVCQWMIGAPDVLITAGWDKQIIFYDIMGQAPMMQFTLLEEAFSFTFLLSQGQFAVGTGNASNSESGQIEFFDMANSTRTGTYNFTHIPRGLGVLPTDDSPVVANHTGTFLTLKRDADGDGWLDNDDAFPLDPTQHQDTDQDGWGDDSSQLNGDGCPTVAGTSTEDRYGCPDSDGDGYSDPDGVWLAHPAGGGDAYVSNPAQWYDTDGDGHGDNYTYQIGMDGLREAESGDAFYNDVAQYRDRDGDNCGDNYTYSLDNGMRINEAGDAFPTDATQCNDFDGDGYGDNYTYTVDGNGLRVENGDAFPSDNLAWSDLDGDGCPTDSATGLDIDLHPTNPDACTEEIPFTWPAGLTVTISNDATLWQVNISWTSADANTLQVLLSTAETDANGIPTSGDYVTRQVWTTLGTVDESIPIDRATSNTGLLHVHLIVAPNTGDSLEQDWSALWFEESIGGGGTDNGSGTNGSGTNGGETNGSGGSDTGGGTQGEGDGTGDGGAGTGDEAQTDDGESNGKLVMVLVAVMVLVIMGLLLFAMKYNRGTTEIVQGAYTQVQPDTDLPPQPRVLPPCKVCDGPVQEVIHQGNLWSWCPTCRAWLDFLGKQ